MVRSTLGELAAAGCPESDLMTTQEPSDSDGLLDLAPIVVGSFAVLGLGLVTAAIIGIVRGGAPDAFASLAVAGVLLGVFAIHLHRVEPDDDGEASPEMAMEAPQPEHERFWQPTFSLVIACGFVAFGAYFALRQWKDYPPWFAALFVGVVLLLLLLRGWISWSRKAKKRGSASR